MRKSIMAVIVTALMGCAPRHIQMTGGVPRSQFVPVFYNSNPVVTPDGHFYAKDGVIARSGSGVVIRSYRNGYYGTSLYAYHSF